MRIAIPLERRCQVPVPFGTAILIAAVSVAAAQTQAPATPPAAGQKPASTAIATPASTSTHKSGHSYRKPVAAHQVLVAPQAAPVPQAPPPPPMPHWPLNDRPAEASVVWDSQGLRISAANSSLQQILKDVTTATGTKVDGLTSDERVFGAYGPGQARDVLAELLQGSGYNILMIGDQGQGAPRQIVLTARSAAPIHPPTGNKQPAEEDTEAEEPPQPPQQFPQPPLATPDRPGITPGGLGGPPRSPQQIMQEMQQRQQQLQQQQLPQ